MTSRSICQVFEFMNVWDTNRFSDRLDLRRHLGPVFDPNRAYISDCKFIEHYEN